MTETYIDVNCIFCKIVAKQAPVNAIYEDDLTLAFLDIRPLNVGHTLVIPKAHYIDIFDIPKEMLGHIHSLTKTLAFAIKKATNAQGITIIQQNGAAAGQDIFHLHVHIVPRFVGQKLPNFNELKKADRSDLALIAKKIQIILNQ